MVITMHYADGIDLFDTSDRADPPKIGGNLLSNWSLKLEEARNGDEFGGKRLWLRLYAHDNPEDGAEGPGGLPAARRRDIACFLLADEEDVAGLLRVDVDGSSVLVRIGDELVNADRFGHASDLTGYYIPQTVLTRRALDAALADDVEGDPVTEICAMMGYTPEAYASAELMHRRSEATIR